MVDIITHGGDGYDDFEDRVQGADGDERAVSRGIIQGDRILFTNEGKWIVGTNPDLPVCELELVAVDVLRLVQNWHNNKVKTRILKPGEPVPDLAELNARVPIEQWEVGPNGQKVGPYQFAYCVYLFHEPTVKKYTLITSTIGGGIAIRELVDAVRWFRKWRQGGVCPVVQLGTAFMQTKYGGRLRPSFRILRWVRPGGQDDVAPLAPRPTPQLSAANGNQPLNDNMPAHQHQQAVGESPIAPLQNVETPSLKEEMNDEIPI